MIGKKNVVFGLLFLVFTAALGPLMVNKYESYGEVAGQKQEILGKLQQAKADGYEVDLEPLSADDIARMNSDAILALNKLGNEEFAIDFIKGGPHAHGNLEALLNIVIGILLCFLSASALLKQAISWMFIVGTLFHSGLLYFERLFLWEWSSTLLGTGIGPVLILVGLLLTGVVAFKSFEGRPVQD